jgi:hypothetical protein
MRHEARPAAVGGDPRARAAWGPSGTDAAHREGAVVSVAIVRFVSDRAAALIDSISNSKSEPVTTAALILSGPRLASAAS